MKKNTRFAFNAYLQQLARLNGVAVEELSSKFTVEPSVQQTLEDQIQQSAAFLTLINVTPVTEQSGQLLGLGVGSTIAGTTDTTAKEREPVDPTLMVDVEYKCEQTNFDTVLTYAKLDLWAKFQDFQVRIRDAIVKRQALDRIMIGFNGVKRAKTSNRSENPLLQDVNKGWLQKIREDAPDHVMGSTTTGGETTPGAVKVGKGGEYANLDAVVMDAVNELIDVVYQDDDDLVVICGRELLSDKYFPLVNKEQENSEKLAADMIISQKRMGGLQAVRAPFFPPNALLITRLDNLSIYWQEDTRRRSVIDNPKRDRIENFESVNEAYVVEDYRCAALVENIQIGDFSAAAAELQYQRSWRHAANSRVNRRPSTQFLGPDNDMLTLSGVLMPEITGGRLSLLALEQMAEQGKAWPLIEGSGTIYGMYVIEGLNQTKTEFFRDGMPRRIEFTLSLKRVDESLSDMFGDLSAQLNNLQDTATSALSDISKTVGGLLS